MLLWQISVAVFNGEFCWEKFLSCINSQYKKKCNFLLGLPTARTDQSILFKTPKLSLLSELTIISLCMDPEPARRFSQIDVLQWHAESQTTREPFYVSKIVDV